LAYTSGRTAFPLVPRYRLAGLPFGEARSTRRGRGTDHAGFRAYVPGDPVSTIDWHVSAKLSTARGDDEFVVRERYADEAPRVVTIVDRRPSMRLYPAWSPWLSKPDTVRRAVAAIVESALASRGAAGYLDVAEAEPFWLPPRARSPLEVIEDRADSIGFDASPASLAHGIDYLARSAATLGTGSFVFVLSDFLAPPPESLWLAAVARRWDIVPVVIQDPVWEQTFPSVGPVILPLEEPVDGAVIEVKLRRSEARAERDRRERQRADLLARFASLGLDPVLLDRSDEEAVVQAFFEWGERRRRALWQRR
jgi:uncharacterized protein (DUF58 family)